MTIDIKICGLKTVPAIDAALAGGATHIGLIFFPKSPRHIALDEAALLSQHVRGRAKVIAVTVDADNAGLDAIVAAVAPDILQLHGNEPAARVAEVKARYGLPVMKALAIRSADDLVSIAPYRTVADRFLFDAKAPEGSDLPGGNGVTFDWRVLGALDPTLDYMLSGGLNAGNISEALRLATPGGIDISSGVESAPGIKDAALIAEFFSAIRAAQAEASAQGRS